MTIWKRNVYHINTKRFLSSGQIWSVLASIHPIASGPPTKMNIDANWNLFCCQFINWSVLFSCFFLSSCCTGVPHHKQQMPGHCWIIWEGKEGGGQPVCSKIPSFFAQPSHFVNWYWLDHVNFIVCLDCLSVGIDLTICMCFLFVFLPYMPDLPKMESEGLLMGGNGFIKVASTTAVSQRHLGQPRPHVRTARFYFLKKLPEHVAVHIVLLLLAIQSNETLWFPFRNFKHL